MTSRLPRLALALGALLAAAGPAQELLTYDADPIEMTSVDGRRVPRQVDRYVNDFAGLLDSRARQKIFTILEALEQDTEQRITLVTYPGLQPFGWQDSPGARDDFTQVLYQAWGMGEGQNKALPGHLWSIGHSPRHVLYVTKEGFRLAWVRELRDLMLDGVPIPLGGRDLPEQLVAVVEDAELIVRDHTGVDWITVLLTLGGAGLLYGLYSWLLHLRSQDAPPPPPQHLAAPTLMKADGSAYSADDLVQDLRPGKKP